MEKLTLTYVGRFTEDKNGNPLVSKKTGKPYTSLRIKANEYGDKYLSGFDGPSTKDWKAGDSVEVEVKPNGEYLNFDVPRAERGGGMSPEQYMKLTNEIRTGVHGIRFALDSLRAELIEAGVIIPKTSAGTPVPDFTARTMNEDKREAPEITEDDLAGVF